MKNLLRFTKLSMLASMLVCAFALGGTARAQITLTPTITNLSGGLFGYAYTVNNSSLFDFSAISITVIAAPQTVQSLVVPTGFSGFFDDGLGQVDFVEDTQDFAAGTNTSGFSFTSPFAPQSSTFTALRLDETTGAPVTVTGTVLAPAIPEPSSIVLIGSALSGLALLRVRRREVAK